MITFYDIPSTLSGTWNPNTYKTRFSLKLKGLEYKTEWVEYPDIAGVYKQLGADAPSKKSDGTPSYTLPMIKDDSTGAIVAESFKIAQYLDETYPDTPRLVPKGLTGLISAFLDEWLVKFPPWAPFALPKVYSILTEKSQPYFKQTREPMMGKPFEEWVPAEKNDEMWQNLFKTLDWVDSVIKLNESDGFQKGYICGDGPNFADLAVVSRLMWWKTMWGPDSKEWKEMASYNGGRWAKFVKLFQKYEQ